MADAEAPRWSIIGQREDYRPGPGGAFILGRVVTFQTSAGDQGTIFLPVEQYTADNVKAAIDKLADTMLAVSDLTG